MRKIKDILTGKCHCGLGIILLTLALFLRLWSLGQAPYGFTNDEVSYIYNAYSIWETGGYDLEGKFLPVSMQVDSSISPVPVYLTAPIVGLLSLSPFTARLPFALLGVGAVLLVYLVARRIFENEFIAFASAFVFAISPWHLLLSRGAWDGGAALFFYLLGIFLFIRGVKKGNTILWPLPAFFLAFYSYHATKVYFLFLIPVLLIVFFNELKNRKKDIFIFGFGVLFIVISFFLVSKTQNVTRQQVLLFGEAGMIEATKQVDYERQKSTAPFWLRTIISNKPVFFARVVSQKYLEVFSPQFLFTSGDISYVWGYGNFLKGTLYFIELPLLLFGLYFIIRLKNKRITLFILLLMFIAPIPAAVATERTYLIRAIMLLPILTMLIGCGIYYLFNKASVHSQKSKFLFSSVIVLVYVLSFSSFSYSYFYQFSTVGAEYWSGSSRKLAEYIGENNGQYTDIYIAYADDLFLLQYGFFNTVDPLIIQKAWAEKWPAHINKITIDRECLQEGQGDPKKFLPAGMLYIAPPDCHKKIKATKRITDPIEPIRVIWNIYERK